ncbi:MAG: ubiquinone/menaquinone biosynthesis C-methylase UbiE [Halobacteriales archaeon]|jgi:ubiquinone/menaquinone biosynthesis C-methylase UbiE
MTVREEFDQWAADGRDESMADEHWHTAKEVLARMPVEPEDVVLDLGSGSGYAVRALRAKAGASRAYGLDASPEMAGKASGATGDPKVGFVAGTFTALPFADDSIDNAFSMEAFYYAADPIEALQELRRVLRPGGTFHCAVNYFEENPYSHDWSEYIAVDMTLWSRSEYREAFREAGFHVASQDNVPDLEIDIPPKDTFPLEEWETREAMVERYRELGTLLTVGVAP